MAERRQVVPTRTLSYSGYFDGKEIYKHIKNWVKDMGYDEWREPEHTEKNAKTHRQAEITYIPEHKISDYIKMQIRFDITYMNLKSATVKYKNKDVKVDEGDLEIVFRGYIVSDYDNKWENKAHWFFLRTIMDKFILRAYYSKYETELANQIKELYNNLREYLNVTKQN